MEGPLLPEGSGGEEPPAWLRRQLEAYARGLEAAAFYVGPAKKRRRRPIRGYTIQNCEEAIADRGRQGATSADGLGRYDHDRGPAGCA